TKSSTRPLSGMCPILSGRPTQSDPVSGAPYLEGTSWVMAGLLASWPRGQRRVNSLPGREPTPGEPAPGRNTGQKHQAGTPTARHAVARLDIAHLARRGGAQDDDVGNLPIAAG